MPVPISKEGTIIYHTIKFLYAAHVEMHAEYFIILFACFYHNHQDNCVITDHF